MTDSNFTPADFIASLGDFFRLGNDASAHESALRIKEAEALADVRIKLAKAGALGGENPSPSAEA